jgi:hypothetical protein
MIKINSKAWKIFIFGFIIIFLLIISYLVIHWDAIVLIYNGQMDSNFATEALLQYNCTDEKIAVKVTDKNDIRELKGILKGYAHKDSPSCSFSTDISITMTSESQSIVFCTALDGCPLLEIGDSYTFITISDRARTRLNEIYKKYGIASPLCW